MGDLNKYLEDVSFIRWILEPTAELTLYWEQHIQNYPEEEKNIRLARKITSQFKITAQKLSDEGKILLFSEILKKIEEKQRSQKQIKLFSGLLKYAAVALIFFSTGALLFYRPSTTIPAFMALNANNRIYENKAQLIRSNGENVILDNKRSLIEYKKNGEVVINKDTLLAVRSESNKQQAINQLIVPYGSISEIILPDGTKAILNAGSRLAYPDHFDEKSREVMLSGEAYFEVKHDSKHPFVVLANNLRIKDIGTKFNISAYPADRNIETVVTEGKVNLKESNAGLFSTGTDVVQGQLASFDRQNSQMKVNNVEADSYILWTQNLMRFESVDLYSVIRKLERYYNVRFSFNDPALKYLKISGKLELKEDMQEIVDRIAHTTSVTIDKNSEDSYVINKRK